MYDRAIACIHDTRYIPKAGKYIVKLGFRDEKAEEVWMTGRQLVQLERVFSRTPHGYSSDRLKVIGVWNDAGYYAYARLERETFIQPHQYGLKDLEEDL